MCESSLHKCFYLKVYQRPKWCGKQPKIYYQKMFCTLREKSGEIQVSKRLLLSKVVMNFHRLLGSFFKKFVKIV